MMSRSGVLRKIFDNEKKNGQKYWALIIEENGSSVKVNLFDSVFAGLPGKNGEEAICDIHTMEGQTVIFDAEAGKPKEDGSGEHWPDTIKMIGPSIVQHEPAEEPLPIQHNNGRSANIEAAMAVSQHLNAARTHIAAAEEELKKVG